MKVINLLLVYAVTQRNILYIVMVTNVMVKCSSWPGVQSACSAGGGRLLLEPLS